MPRVGPHPERDVVGQRHPIQDWVWRVAHHPKGVRETVVDDRRRRADLDPLVVAHDSGDFFGLLVDLLASDPSGSESHGLHADQHGGSAHARGDREIELDARHDRGCVAFEDSHLDALAENLMTREANHSEIFAGVDLHIGGFEELRLGQVDAEERSVERSEDSPASDQCGGLFALVHDPRDQFLVGAKIARLRKDVRRGDGVADRRDVEPRPEVPPRFQIDVVIDDRDFEDWEQILASIWKDDIRHAGSLAP